jgi:diguanylate cyclase (GGDEF)-like protein/PAS domain S-box-containing protein
MGEPRAQIRRDRDAGTSRVKRGLRQPAEASRPANDAALPPLEAVLAASPHPVVAVDAHGTITYVSPQISATFGYEREELIGKPIEILVPDNVAARHTSQRDGFIAHRTARPMGIGLDLAGRRKDGSVFPVEIGLAPVETPSGPEVFATIVDISARKAAEAAIERARAEEERERAARDAQANRERARLEAELHKAQLDDLTGAYRREMGTLVLTHEIDRARRSDGRFILAFVDVDNMKRVNDELGHAAGDRLLKTLVATMRSNLRSFDPILRYGGDEFVCGLSGTDLRDAERRFASIGRAVKTVVGVGVSVGLAALEADETLDQLMARADAALLAAKKASTA